MAIDTAAKRKSASQTLTGLFGPGVTPDAANDAEWRQQVGWGYSGIAITATSFTQTLSTAQSMRQQAFRNKAGSSGGYNEDMILAIKSYLGGSPTGAVNELITQWLSQKLSVSGKSVNELKALAAKDRGKSKWDDLDGDDIHNLLQ